MKKLLLIVAFAGLLLSGCAKEKYDTVEEEILGAVSIGLKSSGEFTQATKGADASVEDFYVKILKGEAVVKSYDKYSQMPNAIEIAPGTYTIEAGSHGDAPAAFDQPVYFGQSEFSITAGNVVSVDVTCKLQNMKVTIQYTEAFGREVAPNYEIAVTNGTGNLIFTKEIIDAGRSGYFSVGALSIRLNGTRTSSGEEILHFMDIPDGKAQDHFVLTFDAKETGDILFGDENKSGITIDYTVNNRNIEIIVPGEDETEIPDDNTGDGGDNGEGGEGGNGGQGGGQTPVEQYFPVISGDGVGTAKEISMSANNDNITVDINLATLNGKTIKDVLVTISSEPSDFQDIVALLFPPLTGTFSIVDFSDAAGADRKAVLGPGGDGLGLIADPDVDPILGKTSYTFKIGHFMGALATTGLSEGTLCKFTLKVVDSEDKETTATCVIKMVK